MTDVATPLTATASTDIPASKSLGARALGVVFSPRETYADVAAHPRVLGIVVLVLLISIAASTAFLMTEVGKDALFDTQIQTMESWGFTVTDQIYDQMESRLQYAPYTTAAFMLIGFPIMWTAIAGILMGVFTLAMGGAATFKQVYAVVAHSAVLMALQQVFINPLNYQRQLMSSPTTLSAFFPFLDDMTFMARLLGGIDLFFIWMIINQAIGVGVLYKRKTAPIAIGMLALYVSIVLIVAAVRTALSGA
jgi:Yip1-like protein